MDCSGDGICTIFILGSNVICISSFLTVGIFTNDKKDENGKSFKYSPGIMERVESFFFFVLMIYFEQYYIILTIMYVLLITITVLFRVREFKIYINSHNE